MTRVLKILLPLLIFGFFPAWPVRAADLNIDCLSSPAVCNQSGLDPLFSDRLDGFWYPGRSVTKTLGLKNSSPKTRQMAIKGTRTFGASSLEDVMHVSIVGGDSVIWSGPISDFYRQEKIAMGVFAPGSSLNYKFTVSMSHEADNSYQNKQTVFDLTLGFWEEVLSTSTTTSSSAGDVLGVGVGAPACDSAEPGLPTNLTVSGSGAGKATLSWTAPAQPYSYFLVTYSDNPAWPPKWGNPNVGEVTYYTVSNLGSGSYWFWVRAGNGCAPGPFTGPVQLAISGPNAGVNIAAGFTPGVLGVSSQESSPSPQNQGLGPSGVSGVGTGPGSSYWLWLLVILTALIPVSFFLKTRFFSG